MLLIVLGVLSSTEARCSCTPQPVVETPSRTKEDDRNKCCFPSLELFFYLSLFSLPLLLYVVCVCSSVTFRNTTKAIVEGAGVYRDNLW